MSRAEGKLLGGGHVQPTPELALGGFPLSSEVHRRTIVVLIFFKKRKKNGIICLFLFVEMPHRPLCHANKQMSTVLGSEN